MGNHSHLPNQLVHPSVLSTQCKAPHDFPGARNVYCIWTNARDLQPRHPLDDDGLQCIFGLAASFLRSAAWKDMFTYDSAMPVNITEWRATQSHIHIPHQGCCTTMHRSQNLQFVSLHRASRNVVIYKLREILPCPRKPPVHPKSRTRGSPPRWRRRRHPPASRHARRRQGRRQPQ